MADSLRKKTGQFIGRLAFGLARSWFGHLLAGWAFGSLSFALPVKRLHQTDNWLAFYHPQPAYPVHILIVPRHAIHSLADLPTTDESFISELFQVVQSLVAELGLEEQGYRLVVNGGKYQDLPQLHFHLISEESNIPQDRAVHRSP